MDADKSGGDHGWINIHMKSSAPWPINKFGTAWRHVVMYFDWHDEKLVWEAIETIDPLKITVCQRPVAAIGFDRVADMVMHYLADSLPPNSRWNNDGMLVIIDPCADPIAMEALVEEQMENVQFSIFGVAHLDIANEATCRTLLNALADRHEWFLGEAPVIEL
jgi:hypothetical protein